MSDGSAVIHLEVDRVAPESGSVPTGRVVLAGCKEMRHRSVWYLSNTRNDRLQFVQSHSLSLQRSHTAIMEDYPVDDGLQC